MQVTSTDVGNAYLIQVNGEINAETAQTLDLKTSALLDDVEKHIIMDFSRLEYLASAGLRILIKITRRLKTGGHKLILHGVCGSVLDVIKVAGFHQILEIVPNLEAASAMVK